MTAVTRRYRGKHLKPRPKKRGPVVVGTATAVWLAGPASHAHPRRHLVRPGETLSAIAARYGTSAGALAAANGLSDTDVVLSGQRLVVTKGETAGAVHVVRAGETLSSVAAAYGSDVRALARANAIRDPDFILAGMRLRVPARAVAPAAAPAQSDLDESLEHHAVSHGVDPALVKAVAWQESGWRQNVRSEAGAIGVMQVMPATARYVNRALGGDRLRVRRAADNIHLGVMYLRHMLRSMGSERKALAAYYTGPRAVGRRLNRIQRAYVNSVTALKARFTS